MRRRSFVAGSAIWIGSMSLRRLASAAPPDAFMEIERQLGGRLGLAAVDTGTGTRLSYRASERFAMCSTFKWMLAAAVLAKIRREHIDLGRPLRFSPEDVVAVSPVTGAHVAEGSLSIRTLCEAMVEVSDNTAANTLLKFIGGPESLTRYLRSIGDPTTRLDRFEPDLNSNVAGDPRDTTTPEAMIATMRTILLGDALPHELRETLLRWLKNCQNGLRRLRAGLPKAWVVGDKPGTGINGATNDSAIAWPKGRSPILIAAYLSESAASAHQLEAALAQIGGLVAAAFA